VNNLSNQTKMATPQLSKYHPIISYQAPENIAVVQDFIHRLIDQQVRYVWSKLEQFHARYDVSYVSTPLRDVLLEMAKMDYEDIVAVLKHGIKEKSLPGRTETFGHIPPWAESPSLAVSSVTNTSTPVSTSPVDERKQNDGPEGRNSSGNSDQASAAASAKDEGSPDATISNPGLTPAASSTTEEGSPSVVDLASPKDEGIGKQDDGHDSQLG
jgi:hypothetical protein